MRICCEAYNIVTNIVYYCTNVNNTITMFTADCGELKKRKNHGHKCQNWQTATHDGTLCPTHLHARPTAILPPLNTEGVMEWLNW